jgi:cytochrome bd-type quinol oxidase subunit 1
MYKWVITERLNENSDKLYDLNPHRFKSQLKTQKWNKKTREMEETKKPENVWTVMHSVTLRCFYGLLTLIIIGIIVFQCIQGKSIKKPDKQTSLCTLKQKQVDAE